MYFKEIPRFYNSCKIKEFIWTRILFYLKRVGGILVYKQDENQISKRSKSSVHKKMKTTFQKDKRKSGFHPKNENHISIINRKIS